MATVTVLEFNHDFDNFPADDVKAVTEWGTKVASFLRAGIAGTRFLNSVTRRGHAVQAAGTLTLSTASGTVGGTINSVALTVTASGGDTATAAAIAAAINVSVNSLIAGVVTATSSGAVVTVTAVQPGLTGNAITLVASGTGVTASAGRLTGGLADTAVVYLP